MIERRGDIALLALRLFLGAAFVLHGLPKILHPGTWAAQALPGVPPWLAAVAAFVEFGGGIALIVGLATPVFAFLIGCNMVVAIWFVLIPHGAKFVNDAPGASSYEKPLAYLIIALALILLGPGRFALDTARSGKRGRKR